MEDKFLIKSLATALRYAAFNDYNQCLAYLKDAVEWLEGKCSCCGQPYNRGG